ncbi:DUF4097 family beta strand repeat-containing protein [Lederbergia lenta]|uniref:YvlB n=1 Tax=Lederbergia lenta TaxID=1467 RepID=A0A2X4ZN80_LEDLE|nr:DUF4097 domain-containing protein [Lederbergia lenta]MEC2322796.1 DUF4097 domain-containing protein [Lederbergia lenta]SQI61864.1 YvlB [Lederbergia lenta]
MSEERKRILELVQDGKLSAQEAIILLEALEKDASLKEKVASDAANDDNANTKSQTTREETASKDSSQSTENTKEDTFYSQLENAGERIFDFVNNALHKIKNVDLQFTQSVDIPHTFQQEDSEIEKIDVDVANGPIRLIAWDQPEVRVECQAKVYRSDDREEARKYFLDNTIFSIENGLLCFATQSKWMRVETVIYIPEKQYKKVSIRIFNGGLTGENIHSEFLTVKTTNGKVELDKMEGRKFEVDTVNGQIKLTGSKVEELEAETVNGTVDVSGIFQVADIQSFNGNISCTLPEIGAKRIEAKVVTGNINIYLPEGATVDGDVRSNLGSYKLDLEGINVSHEKKEMIQKQVQFKRPGREEEVIHLLADTKTGSVLVKQVN